MLIIFSCSEKKAVIIKDELKLSGTEDFIGKLESDLIKSEDDGLVYYKKSMELFSGIWIKPENPTVSGGGLTLLLPEHFIKHGFKVETEPCESVVYRKNSRTIADLIHCVKRESLMEVVSLLNNNVFLQEKYCFGWVNEESYKNGKINGLQKRHIILNQYYMGDIKNVQHRKMNDTILMEKFNIRNNLKHGKYQSWYTNEQIKTNKNYSNGKIINEECWDTDGRKINCNKEVVISETKNDDSSNYYIFLDGTKISKDKVLRDCIKSFQRAEEENIFKNQGIGMCDCIFEKISKNFTFKEFKEMQGNSNNDVDKAYNLFNNDKIKSLVLDCYKTNIPNDSNFKITSDKELEALKEIVKNNLKNSMTSSDWNMFINSVNTDAYFECYTKWLIKEFSAKELMNLDINDKSIAAKIQGAEELCFNKSLN
tara:strand:- start:76 stop:1350 length:1275 start_codon:yes stop_codon:yes gene_type:complete